MKQAAGYHILADVATGVAAGLLVFAWLTAARLQRVGAVAAA